MKNRREKENLFITLDSPDFIATRGDITLSEGGERIFVEQYRERVEKINNLVEKHPAVTAIRRGEAVSDEQLIALEKVLRKIFSASDVRFTKDNFRKVYGFRVNSFLGFIRHPADFRPFLILASVTRPINRQNLFDGILV